MTVERIEYIDFLKGIFIALVVITNLTQMNGPFWDVPRIPMGSLSDIDSVFADIIYMLGIPELSNMFIFILGHNAVFFVLKYRNFAAHCKRCFFFIILGLVHMIFFYWGDILFYYGFCSLFLFNLTKMNIRKIEFMLAFIFVIFYITYIYIKFFHQEVFIPDLSIDSHLGFGTLPFWELVKLRASHSWEFNLRRLFDFSSIKFSVSNYLFVLNIFIYSTLGIWAARTSFIKNLKITSKVMLVILTIFISGQILKYNFQTIYQVLIPIRGVFNLFLGLVFVKTIYKFFQASYIKTLLCNAGRNSLTIYFGGSVLGTLVLSSFGLALYQKIGPFNLFLIGFFYFWLIAYASTKQKWLVLENLWRSLLR
ncbi:MAG: hypothetical protein CME65_05770 [Halobacteriovoraceae bacterium]|nr:hypothetical protein [Halobacteriovoraceae bacterium]|tara:strand:+ start:20344 stop:21441 length:1098 start_codon:yes stop_codon:yes gene_type:complete